MTTLTPLATWLRTRTPAPPDALTARIESMTAAQAADPPSAETLLASAESALARVLHDGCLTRASALDLLAVDAIVTYAFEAAADDPERIDERAAKALAMIAALAEPYKA